MSVSLSSFVWASAGIEPENIEDAIYSAGKQPIAGYDNFWNWAVSTDIENINDWIGSHGHVHESGGTQEINLAGLSIGSAGVLDAATGEVQLTDSGGTPLVRLDTSADEFLAVPSFGERTVHSNGLGVGADIERTSDGVTVYDYSADEFHRAAEAGHADTAGLADDSLLFDGNQPSAFIRPDDATRTITGEWEFTQDIDADITGHAQTANYASLAGEADEAALADAADTLVDDPTLQNPTYYDTSDLGALAEDETVTGHWTFQNGLTGDLTGTADHALTADHADEADYADVAGSVESLDGEYGDITQDVTVTGNWTFNNTITGDISGDAAWADNAGHADTADYADNAGHADTADFATEAEYANNSDQVDGYHAHELVDEAVSKSAGRWEFIAEKQVESLPEDPDTNPSGSRLWYYDIPSDKRYDRYRIVLVNENQTNGFTRWMIRVNDDYRNRYNWTELDHGPGDRWRHRNIGHWPIASTMPNRVTTEVYDVACPKSLGGDTRHWPTISLVSGGHSREQHHVLQHGHMEVDYDEIYRFNFNGIHDHDTTIGYIQIYGNDII